MPQLAFAQTFPPQDGVVADDTGRLNASEINSASADLKALGVKPLVLLVQSPQGYSGSLDLAYAAADNYGLGQGNRQVDANLLALVVVLSTRQSTVLYGDALKPVMEGGSGGGLAEQIRTNHLNTNLAAGKYTQAFAESLKFAAQQIDLARNPLPTATPQPSIIQNVDTSGLGNSLLICVVIGIVLGALAIFAPMLWRNRQRANAAALRRRSLQEQLLQARNVSADMITNLDFPVDPNEQIQFRFLALALEKERPEQLAPIATQYRQVYDRVAGALSTYNQLNESQPASEEEMTAAIGQYQQVQSEIKYASGFIDWLGQQSRNLEAEIASAPGEVDAAKKALAAATEQISRLAAAAPELNLPGAEQLLRPALTGIGQAEKALQAEPPRSLTARADAIAARTGVGNLGASIKSLSDLYSTIAEQRRKIAAMEAQGYKLTQSRDLLDHGLSLLTGAAQAITERGEAFAATLQKARTALEQASTLASQAASLRAANEAALARLSAAGEDLKGLIKQGAEAFDAVDEYAEESWRDIRGNGTEAQRAADEAYTLWQEASKLNALTPDSEQDFTGASGLIVQANECVQTARQLIQAIIERLAHIRESQAAAKDEIAAAQRDVQGGLQFVAQFDRDISSKRDEDLQRASGHLEKARAEMAQSKPDWIAVVKLAREANDLADQALRDARTEHEQMEARRLKVKTTSQQAAAALSRAANFAAAHKIDILAPIFASIKEVQGRLAHTSGTLENAKSRELEDVAMAQALDAVAAEYIQAVQQADVAYQQAESQFQTMEQLRKQASDAVVQARTTIESATNYINQNTGAIRQESVDMLNRAIDTLPAWRDGSNASTLEATLHAAQQADEEASGAMDAAMSDVDEYNRAVQGQRTQDVLNAVLAIGAASLASGGRRRSRGGWGGGWGSGSSGGLGGGGGSTSGGWGGGGSSSGSWGGGGSSGGSWGGGGSSSGGW